MKSSFAHFEELSKIHRCRITQRGYLVREQLFYKNSAIRKLYRILTNRHYEGWRTYWKAEGRKRKNVFIKVYFGHNDPGVNLINGTKQVKLTHHFSSTLADFTNISLPHIEDHWMIDGMYFIAFLWRDIQTINLCALLRSPSLRSEMYALIEALSRTQPPSWWSQDVETHNFALTDYDADQFSFTSPFDVDFMRNIVIESGERIYFHDFEKFQWSRKGLLKLNFVIHCYLQYLRGQCSVGEQVANELLDGFAEEQKRASFDLCISIMTSMLENGSEPSITSSEMRRLRSLVHVQ